MTTLHPELCLAGSGQTGCWKRCSELDEKGARSPEIVGWTCKKYGKQTHGLRLDACKETPCETGSSNP